MARNIKFENHQNYHILNKTKDSRDIFKDKQDYSRFIYLCYACRTGKPMLNLWREDSIEIAQAIFDGESVPISPISKTNQQLVDINAFCLMPDHFHFIFEQKADNGIALFMQKISTAYTKYFNSKYKKTGRLFQGPFKAVLINNENGLLRVSRYIHLSPLDFFDPLWQKTGIKDWQKAIRFLENFQVSSLPEYLGKRQSKLITIKGFYNLFSYKDFLMNWHIQELKQIKSLILEKNH